MPDGYYWAKKDPDSDWEVIHVQDNIAYRVDSEADYYLSLFFEIKQERIPEPV